MKPVSNAPKVMDGEVKLIAAENLVPFKRHRFSLYEGERLADMVESIKENGVIVPIIVRTMPASDKYEIICGHNRVYASGLAGIMKVPAVIKTDMSDEIAMIYATDSNLIQRSFSELRISEQAYAVALRYHKLFDERKIAEIDEELLQLEREKSPVGTGENSYNVQSPLGTEKKIDIFSLTGKDYGLHRTTVTRLIRINELTDDLKKLVDTGNIKIRPAVELSYLSTDVQKMLYECMSRTGINTISQNTAWELKELCKN